LELCKLKWPVIDLSQSLHQNVHIIETNIKIKVLAFKIYTTIKIDFTVPTDTFTGSV